MKQPSVWRGAVWWPLVLTLGALLLVQGADSGETLKITMDNQFLYSKPNFASPTLGMVLLGVEVPVVQQAGDWYQVDYQGTVGWLHRMVFGQAKAPTPSLPAAVDRGAPVREARSDEVALAGKGFTPEVEAGYRQNHPAMNYAMVDQIEALRVDEADLLTFIREGGLKP